MDIFEATLENKKNFQSFRLEANHEWMENVRKFFEILKQVTYFDWLDRYWDTQLETGDLHIDKPCWNNI